MRRRVLYSENDADKFVSKDLHNWRHMQWNERLIAAYKNCPYAPPDYPGAPYRPRLPEPPYEGAPGWKCSVYYYWWEYLRRHAGYRATCEAGGKGEHGDLYGWFGNVHAKDFHTWWWEHLWLFTFVSDANDIDLKKPYHIECEGIFLHVGYSRSRTEMVNAVRDVIGKLRPDQIEGKIRALYRYYPSGRPRLRSLHEHLLVWDARQANPQASDADIADLAGLTGLDRYEAKTIAQLRAQGDFVGDLERANRRAKQLAVQRHLRIAQQYIDNVVRGQFPVRSAR